MHTEPTEGGVLGFAGFGFFTANFASVLGPPGTTRRGRWRVRSGSLWGKPNDPLDRPRGYLIASGLIGALALPEVGSDAAVKRNS